MTTVHTFTELGLRTMPIGHTGVTLTRDEKGKKRILEGKKVLSFNDVMPANWTVVYGASRTKHKDTPLGGIICGVLSNKEDSEIEVIALDCDNAQAWQLFRALHPDYKFCFESIGKAGGTILYQLPQSLQDLHQYSIKNDTINFEFMAKREGGANAMIYIPTFANKTKAQIPKGAELTEPPLQVVNLLRLLKPRPIAMPAYSEERRNSSTLPFNAPLVKQFVIDCKEAAKSPEVFGTLDVSPLVERVYQIFTPKKFRATPSYIEHKWTHPNSDELMELGAWSEYIIGISAIAGSDPSIDAVLYTDFLQAINAQVDDPMSAKRFLDEVIQPMVTQKASINGKPIWRYNEKWDATSHTIINQYGETLEYYTIESGANQFVEYNHTNKELVDISSISALRDQIYIKDKDPSQEKPPANIVKKLKLIRVEESIRLPLGIFSDKEGHTILNTAEPCFPLRVLREPSLIPETVDEDNLYVKAFNIFIGHLLNEDAVAELFLKQVIAWHAKHLSCTPVILYMVGVGGGGKSHFAEVMETFFGRNATSRPIPDQMTQRFNDYLRNTALLILTETSDATTQQQAGIKSVLKTVTGEKTIDMESKRIKIEKGVSIFALPVLIANDPWYQEDAGDRRLFSIMPREKMIDSPKILEFEKAYGLRIVNYILEGIKLGVISKYVSSFCPKLLPEVPMTADKQQLSLEQTDPIMVVKNVVASGNWFKLFDLMEEYNVDLFFTAMESKHIRDKDCLFKSQLTDLVENIRGSDTFLITNAAISKAFTVRWLPKQAAQYRPRKDNNLAMRLGYVKWAVNIAEPYKAWQVEKMTEGED